MSGVAGVRVVAGYALRESLRRRVFLVVLVLTLAFLALFGLACAEVFGNLESVAGGGGDDAGSLATLTLLGLGMFATLFLGTVLAVFLTLGAIRGDAERGLLQPLVVRPIGRPAFLLGRFLAAATVCAAYVVVVWGCCLGLVQLVGGRGPGDGLVPGLTLVGGVVVMAALSLLGSVFLSSTANGIAAFMAFGAGLVGGLLGSIADALSSSTLSDISRVVALALPFEALYQGGLHALTTSASGLTSTILQLGPFGSSRSLGTWMVPFLAAWLAVVGGLALRGFVRRDL